MTKHDDGYCYRFCKLYINYTYFLAFDAVVASFGVINNEPNIVKCAVMVENIFFKLYLMWKVK